MGKYKIKKLILFLSLIFISCTNEKKNDLEIEILNNNLYSFSKDSDKDSVNIIRFSIKNNSNQIYYVNGSKYGGYKIDGINKAGINMRVFDSKNKELKYHFQKQPQSKSNECILTFINDYNQFKNKYLGYKSNQFNFFEKNNIEKNFFIYPKQEIFFEYSLTLNKSIYNDDDRVKYVTLDKNTQYYSKIQLYSDSTNYKKQTPWDILQTIRINKVKVYHGIIESKVKIPIKIVE
ncbi:MULTISPECIES: hypothetical protein [unclassified Flavobacterium]|uniref:hypothetical protein n=1 Tax=unclassified Flavobacterium TaxID=196869 RepID=UPI001292374E|nr:MULTISPECIES: hypothetical protein [unclassified Flavobacterium]MQP53283.1 hypothetical protein [Flavobacterium sp. LMO9]MQP63294.1 hypothetical protein [Flavobacterium sp. LMO6]